MPFKPLTPIEIDEIVRLLDAESCPHCDSPAMEYVQSLLEDRLYYKTKLESYE